MSASLPSKAQTARPGTTPEAGTSDPVAPALRVAAAPMSLRELVGRVEAAAAPIDLWMAALDFFHSRSVQMVSYHYYGSVAEGMEPMIRADGFPEEWVDQYVEKKLFRVDPIPELAARSSEPFFWSDVEKLTELVEIQEDYLEELRSAKLGEGLGVPVFGPNACNGYFGLGFGPTRPALEPRLVRELQIAGQAAHLRYCGMRAELNQSRSGLSPREREVLYWISRGKSNSVISDIMGVSPHTVDTHVRRIFDKLDVTDRTSAALRGIGAGLLMPFPEPA